MKKIIIIPLIGFSEIKFGMFRKNVRLLLGNYREFFKNEYSVNSADDFGYCHIFYDKDNKFEAVEFFQDVELFIDDKCIFPGTITEIQKIIKDLKEEYGCFISKSKSIGIVVNDTIIESVLVGNSGYYNDLSV